MVRRCEQAEAKLMMNFQAINYGAPYEQQADVLMQVGSVVETHKVDRLKHLSGNSRSVATA